MILPNAHPPKPPQGPSIVHIKSLILWVRVSSPNHAYVPRRNTYQIKKEKNGVPYYCYRCDIIKWI